MSDVLLYTLGACPHCLVPYRTTVYDDEYLGSAAKVNPVKVCDNDECPWLTDPANATGDRYEEPVGFSGNAEADLSNLTPEATLDAGRIFGQLVDAQIAELSADKILGQLTDAQIAGLAAAKVSGQLTDAQIADLSAAKVTGQIAETQIADNSISTPKLQAASVLAENISVVNLAAISVDAGLITAGTFRGPIFETAALDPKVRMDTTGLFVTDDVGGVPTRIDTQGLSMGTSGQFGTDRAVTWEDSTSALRAGLWSRVDLMGNASLRAFAGNEEVTILLEDGRSDFLKIVGSAERKVEFGTATIQINNNNFGFVSVTHNLGGVPIHIDVTITSGHLNYYPSVSAVDSTSFNAIATHKDGVNNTVTIKVSWAAYG